MLSWTREVTVVLAFILLFPDGLPVAPPVIAEELGVFTASTTNPLILFFPYSFALLPSVAFSIALIIIMILCNGNNSKPSTEMVKI